MPTKMLIAVVDMPRGPVTINDPKTDRLRVYGSEAEAVEDLKNHQLVRAFGGELFELGTGTPL